jgi:hypothetical protein
VNFTPPPDAIAPDDDERDDDLPRQ